MKQCFRVIFMILDLCSYRPLSYKTELTTPAGIIVIENFLNLKHPLKIPVINARSDRIRLQLVTCFFPLATFLMQSFFLY